MEGTPPQSRRVVGSSWLVSGNAFVWLDDSGSITTGTSASVSVLGPTISVSESLTKNSTGANETHTYMTSVQRTLSISSTVNLKKAVKIQSGHRHSPTPTSEPGSYSVTPNSIISQQPAPTHAQAPSHTQTSILTHFSLTRPLLQHQTAT
jgi:hypothetical protein